MATIKLKGNEINLIGDLPEIGVKAPNAILTKTDLSDVSLDDFRGKKVILNIFPSLDTPVCAASVRQFNKIASELENTVVLCISRDLPFAQARFCGAEGLDNVITLSEMKDDKFSKDFGLRIMDGPLASLMARSVIIIDEDQIVKYIQLVPEITQEPDYNEVLQKLK